MSLLKLVVGTELWLSEKAGLTLTSEPSLQPDFKLLSDILKDPC